MSSSANEALNHPVAVITRVLFEVLAQVWEHDCWSENNTRLTPVLPFHLRNLSLEVWACVVLFFWTQTCLLHGLTICTYCKRLAIICDFSVNWSGGVQSFSCDLRGEQSDCSADSSQLSDADIRIWVDEKQQKFSSQRRRLRLHGSGQRLP